MRPKWSDIVKDAFRKGQDVYMQCPTCSSLSYCTDGLEPEKPIDIITLNSCCACILQILLDATPNVIALHMQSFDDAVESVYILDDVLLDVTEDSVVVVPLDKLEEYIESIEELDLEKASTIKSVVANKLD
ncbi:MAG: hypothetical protein QXT53_01355 [Ignisphaera sp.]